MAGGAGSKMKGGRGEREACRLLGDILGGSFVRAPNSGAYVGGKNITRKATLAEGQVRTFKADIIPPDDLPRLVIEAKFYKDFRFHQLLKGADALLDDWIGQAKDVVDPGDAWFVCFKINLRGWFIVVPEADAGHYEFENHCRYQGKHGAFRVTDMVVFLKQNRDSIRSQSA